MVHYLPRIPVLGPDSSPGPMIAAAEQAQGRSAAAEQATPSRPGRTRP